MSWRKNQVNHKISTMNAAGMRAWELLDKPSQTHKNAPDSDTDPKTWHFNC